jgi:hypothetical protein
MQLFIIYILINIIEYYLFMDIFNCSEDRLAELFLRNPQLYNAFKNVFSQSKGTGIFIPEIESGMGKANDFIEKANRTAIESAYFMFQVYDGWCDRMGAPCEGYSLYQKVNDKMLGIYTPDQSVPDFDDIVNYLTKKKIQRIFTLNIPPQDYFGLKRKYTDDDGDTITREALEKEERRAIKEHGIEVILLNT